MTQEILSSFKVQAKIEKFVAFKVVPFILNVYDLEYSIPKGSFSLLYDNCIDIRIFNTLDHNQSFRLLVPLDVIEKSLVDFDVFIAFVSNLQEEEQQIRDGQKLYSSLNTIESISKQYGLETSSLVGTTFKNFEHLLGIMKDGS